jgi:hypothetical protein
LTKKEEWLIEGAMVGKIVEETCTTTIHGFKNCLG